MMVSLQTHIWVTRPQWINALRPIQNGRHFSDDIFKCIFLNENAFRWWLVASQATIHYLNQWWLVYWRIDPSLGLNDTDEQPNRWPRNAYCVLCLCRVCILPEELEILYFWYVTVLSLPPYLLTCISHGRYSIPHRRNAVQFQYE